VGIPNTNWLIPFNGAKEATNWEDAWELLCGLMLRVSGYRTEMYCASCKVRSEFIFVTSCTRPRVAVAHSGEMEEKEVRESARFTYV
jgi:hypothetical protein